VRSAGLAATAAAALALVLSACTAAQPTTNGHPHTGGTSAGSSQTSDPTAPSSSSSSAPSLPVTKVHVEGYPDGTTVGVGMPIIATFNKKITNAKNFAQDTTVTVNGQVVHGGWYFEFSDPASGHVMEAHYRLPTFWPAHAHVHVAFHLKGVSAGVSHHHELEFDGALTSLDFYTGARNIGVVNDATHMLTIHSDGKFYGRFPVSLGAPNTPTYRGIKVIMEQRKTVCMHDAAHTYFECGIKWDQRLTYSGEYLHSAPWNIVNIGHRDTSNGCTNLLPKDAYRLYHFLHIGDVVEYPNADGPPMTLGTGYGDWNLTWSQWQTGGALSTQ
jgi:lipoprotein-anchoring transpeptidase ErfK/SrfK